MPGGKDRDDDMIKHSAEPIDDRIGGFGDTVQYAEQTDSERTSFQTGRLYFDQERAVGKTRAFAGARRATHEALRRMTRARDERSTSRGQTTICSALELQVGTGPKVPLHADEVRS